MTINIKGMGCMHCVARVKKAIEEIGAHVISCEIGKCEIESYADQDKIRETIEGLGFDLISIE